MSTDAMSLDPPPAGAEAVILCPECDSADVGAAWSRDGRLRTIVCNECVATWVKMPDKGAARANTQ